METDESIVLLLAVDMTLFDRLISGTSKLGGGNFGTMMASVMWRAGGMFWLVEGQFCCAMLGGWDNGWVRFILSKSMRFPPVWDKAWPEEEKVFSGTDWATFSDTCCMPIPMGARSKSSSPKLGVWNVCKGNQKSLLADSAKHYSIMLTIPILTYSTITTHSSRTYVRTKKGMLLFTLVSRAMITVF